MVLNGPDLFTDKDIIGEWFYDRVIDPGRYRTWLLSRHGERRIRHGADVINCITYHEEELRDDHQEMALSLVEEFRELEAGKSNYFKERRIEWKDNNAHLVLRKIAKQRKIDRWRREHKEAMKPITESYPFLSDVYSTDFECNRYGDGPTQERIEALPSDFKRNLTTNQASLEEIEIYHDLANSGLTPKQLVYAKEMLRTPQLKDTDLAEEFNVTRRTVWTNRRDVKKALDLAGIEPTRPFSTFLGPLTSNFPTEDAFRLNDPNPEPEEMPMCPSGCGPLGKLEVEGESREDIIGCNVCKLAMPAEY